MKKFTLIAVLLLAGVVVFAGPHHRGGYRGGHHHGGHHGNDGVWLAAGITSIVANGLHIVNAVATPRVVVTTPTPAPVMTYPQPVYQQPQVVYQRPVTVPIQQPVYYQPPVYTQPVYTQPVYAPPVPVVTRYRTVYRYW